MTSSSLQTLRDHIEAWHRRLRDPQRREGAGEGPEHPLEHRLYPPQAAPNLDAAPDLLRTGDRDATRRALGWIVAAPEIPPGVAQQLIEVAFEQTASSDVTVKRSAYRVLDTVFEHEPAMVADHLDTIVDGLGDRYLVVREVTVDVVEAILQRNPGLAGVLYAELLADDQIVRDLALEILIDLADEHPAVLAPLRRYLSIQLADPDVSRPLLVHAILALRSVDPELLAKALPTILSWYPTTDEDLESAILDATLAVGGLEPEDRSRAVGLFLDYLNRPDPSRKRAVAEWLVATVTADAQPADTVRSWASNSDQWDRVRVATAVIEAGVSTDHPILEALVAPGDPLADEIRRV